MMDLLIPPTHLSRELFAECYAGGDEIYIGQPSDGAASGHSCVHLTGDQIDRLCAFLWGSIQARAERAQ